MASRHKPEINRKIDLVRKEIALIHREYRDICSEIPGERIFDILKDRGNLILESFAEEPFWGIFIYRNNQNFFIINSAMTLERQIFAAAHELAHSMEFAGIKLEVLKYEMLGDYINGKMESVKVRDQEWVANRFAAELLVDEDVLKKNYLKLKNSNSPEVVAIKLADRFVVPFRTIAKRFNELGIYSKRITGSLLKMQENEVRDLAKRYECCTRNFAVTNTRKLSGYSNKALTLYENERMTYKRLTKVLGLIDQRPEDFDIKDENQIFEIMKSHYKKQPSVDDK